MIDVVCAVLVDPEHRMLAVQRPEEKSLAGYWEFPGGKVETGETPVAALRRELREELDLDLAEIGECRPLTPVTHVYEFGTIRLVPYLVRCADRPMLKLLEHADFRWIDTDEFGSLDWAPADLPILGELTILF